MPEPEWHDPIVEEVRKVRQEHAARFNYDLRAIFEDIRRRQVQSGHPVVSFATKIKTRHEQVADVFFAFNFAGCPFI